jgi:hypothetical protein
MDLGLRIESKYFGQLLAGSVARNMMRTFFINGSAADKLVRRPEGFAKGKVRTLGVLGAGMMGAGIAYSAPAAGIDVVLLDTEMAKAQAAQEAVVRSLALGGVARRARASTRVPRTPSAWRLGTPEAGRQRHRPHATLTARRFRRTEESSTNESYGRIRFIATVRTAS